MRLDRKLPAEFDSRKIKRIQKRLERAFERFENIHPTDEWSQKQLDELFEAIRATTVLWSAQKESFRKKFFEEAVIEVSKPYLDTSSAINNEKILTSLLDHLQPLCDTAEHSNPTIFVKFLRVGYLFKSIDHDFVEDCAEAEYVRRYSAKNKENASTAGASRTFWRRYALMEAEKILSVHGEWTGISLARRIINPVIARLGRNATPPSLNSLSRFLLREYPDRLKSKRKIPNKINY